MLWMESKALPFVSKESKVDLDLFFSCVLSLTLVSSSRIDIHDHANYDPATHTFKFLELPIFHYGQDVLAACYNHNGVLKIPFTFQLPVDLGASYGDKKASVRYQLQA